MGQAPKRTTFSSRECQSWAGFFTQDHDFLRIAADWTRQRRSFPGVVFAAHQIVSLGGLADDPELLLTCCEPEELRHRVTYLPLRQAEYPRGQVRKREYKARHSKLVNEVIEATAAAVSQPSVWSKVPVESFTK
jgi:hypothetical protein